MKNQIIAFKTRQGFLKYLAVALLLSSFTSCMQKLAPSYNKDIVSAIVSANKETLELLASVDKGTTKATFGERNDKYNKIIGAFGSIASQVRARPIPNSKFKEKVNAILEKNKILALANSDYPSYESINEVIKNLVKMRDEDEKDNIPKGTIDAFKGAIDISINQALTYESFLDREAK